MSIEKTIAGMKVERTYRGPASLLANLINENNSHFMAIVFYERYHQHPILNESLEPVLEFLENSILSGLARLVKAEPHAGTFVFSTGKTWSLAEVIRAIADRGIVPGPRAGLELMAAAGRVLLDASHAAQMYAVYSHGGLTPWRILLRQNAQVEIIGYALPQVEIMDFHRDPEATPGPREDSFRYCPPERIKNDPEDIMSDLFALALIGFELMTTKPVYDGTVDVIRQQAVRGEGSRRIHAAHKELPRAVRDLLIRAIQPDIGDRFQSGKEFLSAIAAVLARPDIPGMSLVEVMDYVYKSTHSSRVQGSLNSVSTSTTIMKRDELMKEFNVVQPTEEPVRKVVDIPQTAKSETSDSLRKKAEPLAVKEEPQQASIQNSEVFRSQRTGKPIFRVVDRSDSYAKSEVQKQVISRQGSMDKASPKTEKSNNSADALVQLLRQSQIQNISKTPMSKVIDVVQQSGSKKTTEKPKKPTKNASEGVPEIKKTPPLSGKTNVEIASSTAPLEKQKRTKDVEPAHKQTPKEVTSASSASPVPVTGQKLGLHGPILSFTPYQNKGKSVYFSFVRGDGSLPLRFKAPLSAKSSEIIGALLLSRLLPLRTDLTGKMVGCYRFAVADEWFPGTTLMAKIPQDQPLHMKSLANRLIWADLVIQYEQKHFRQLIQVGVAVPVASIIDHLVNWLQLPRLQWRLLLGRMELGYYDVLVDYIDEAQEKVTLTLMSKLTKDNKS